MTGRVARDTTEVPLGLAWDSRPGTTRQRGRPGWSSGHGTDLALVDRCGTVAQPIFRGGRLSGESPRTPRARLWPRVRGIALTRPEEDMRRLVGEVAARGLGQLHAVPPSPRLEPSSGDHPLRRPRSFHPRTDPELDAILCTPDAIRLSPS